ncbi:hypothetical protein SAY87_006305 [Trapa incisa]|uniref:Alliinase C-terminal domain-containing protein n=1 Tax=Trapa incisa TaxID=236973 RepID=A0AAN7JWD6_9MYRT|nr:hypothetical protein SAY87_006305 [Trapa incisa]
MAAYAWLRCEREEDEDCYDVLRSANIIGRKGEYFHAENRYVRLSLIRTEDDFNNLIYRLHELVGGEPYKLAEASRKTMLPHSTTGGTADIAIDSGRATM